MKLNHEEAHQPRIRHGVQFQPSSAPCLSDGIQSRRIGDVLQFLVDSIWNPYFVKLIEEKV